jgi:hypothetical protein
MANDCSRNDDPLKLVREGTSQADRALPALSPDAAPVDGRTVAHDIVFARAYAAMLKRYDPSDTQAGDWSGYFGTDPAVPLAMAAIEEVGAYAARTREWFDFLGRLDHAGQADALKDRLGYLYAAVGTVAQALDGLQQGLAEASPLKGVLGNLIRSQLAAALRRWIAYYKGGIDLAVVNPVAPSPPLRVLGREAVSFADVLAQGLSANWCDGATWTDHLAAIAPDTSVYGAGGAPDPFVRIDHCVTHNLFRATFDQFLKVFTRVVAEARAGLADSLDKDAGHAPHYALYLAFLELMGYARDAANGLTRRHLDFYYSTVLGLIPRPAQPGRVHLLAELARQADQFDFQPGRRFKAGKDAAGRNAYFANVADVVANKAAVVSLKTLYRHGAEPVAGGSDDEGRLFASPVADSGDGQGAPLLTADGSWQPFFNKQYVDGALAAIDMPTAQVGFAIASHYLLMAEGARSIDVSLTLHHALPSGSHLDLAGDVLCLLTTAKGWLVKSPGSFANGGKTSLKLSFALDGGDDAIVPYAPKVHGYNFDTDAPLLLVVLRQDRQRRYAYGTLAGLAIDAVRLDVAVDGLRTLAIANDFGPVDPFKPFQPFGPSPVRGSSLIVGSKEMFQKHLVSAAIEVQWQLAPSIYSGSDTVTPTASIELLEDGAWAASGLGAVALVAGAAPSSGGKRKAKRASGSVADDVVKSRTWAGASATDTVRFKLDGQANGTVREVADFAPDETYGTAARQGYVRLKLDQGLGQDAYRDALVAYLKDASDDPGPQPDPPQVPVVAALTASYAATTDLPLDSADEATFLARAGRFFHLAPFGTAERHPYLSGGDAVPLLMPFAFTRAGSVLASEAELYIGLSGLAPPQNLSLLFQVADGTANPLARKPVPHIHWSYLAGDRWVPFPENAVVDATDAWLDSGIVTLAVPREATADNRLLPAGQHWIRAAVHEASDAVCRLRRVAAQALEAVFADQDNAPEFSATPLPPGTITRMDVPDAAVKSIAQPFPSFGGRGAEQPADFYRRVSERLRHKNRAIGLWDYEHLVLEAFPQVYKVKCLDHTRYEPSADGSGPCSGGIYRELAPGHVTLIALPDLRLQKQRDPLKPYTSLGLLGEIQAYLTQRCSGFVQLHVGNPQFEEVRVAFALKLRDGFDEAYCTAQLQAAITRFLSPWAFDGTGAPSFGGKVRKSALIHFVEAQPCVDYVTDFRLYRDVPCQPPGSVDLDEATGSLAVSVLVSAPANRHQITVIRPAPDPALAESCGCDA